MFPKTVFSRDNILEAKQHWTNFEKYVNTQQHYKTIASTLSGHAYRCFKTINDDITNTYDLQITFLNTV